MHASSGILFNHESERRPEQFVTRRISRGAAAIALGLESEVTLGSLDAVRDWSFAGDVMRGRLADAPAGSARRLRAGERRAPHRRANSPQAAFACVDLEAERYIRVDETLVRAPERTAPVGDPSLARRELGWRAEVSFEQLVERMVRADMRQLEAAAQSR